MSTENVFQQVKMKPSHYKRQQAILMELHPGRAVFRGGGK